jgi:hypothetical protein
VRDRYRPDHPAAGQEGRQKGERELVFRAKRSHDVIVARNTLAVACNASAKHGKDLRATALKGTPIVGSRFKAIAGSAKSDA